MSPRQKLAQFIEIAEPLGGTLAEALARAGPLPELPAPTTCLTTRLCRSVAGQQLSTKAALTIWGRVIEGAAEDRIPQHLAGMRHADLRGCGLSEAKANAIRAILKAQAEGGLDEQHLAALPHAERAKALCTIKGVGPWTADMVGIAHFRDPDIWPDGDLVTRTTLAKLTSKRRKTALTAARFAPYRSLLARYMWHIADNDALIS